MTSLFDTLVQQRGAFCELGCGKLAVDPRHVFVRRRKGHPEYDDPINIALLCRTCHNTGYVNSRLFKVRWYKIQTERGYDVDKWLDSLNRKHREFFVE